MVVDLSDEGARSTRKSRPARLYFDRFRRRRGRAPGLPGSMKSGFSLRTPRSSDADPAQSYPRCSRGSARPDQKIQRIPEEFLERKLRLPRCGSSRSERGGRHGSRQTMKQKSPHPARGSPRAGLRALRCQKPSSHKFEGNRPMARTREVRQAKDKEVPAPIAAVLAAEADSKNGHTNGTGASEFAEFLSALQAMRAGDFSVRMSSDHPGLAGKIADTFNEIVAANQRMSQELDRG